MVALDSTALSNFGKNMSKYATQVVKQTGLGYLGGAAASVMLGTSAGVTLATLNTAGKVGACIAGVASASTPVVDPLANLIGPALNGSESEFSIVDKRSESFLQLAGLGAQVYLRALVISSLYNNVFHCGSDTISKETALLAGYVVPTLTEVVLKSMWSNAFKKGKPEAAVI